VLCDRADTAEGPGSALQPRLRQAVTVQVTLAAARRRCSCST